MMPFLLGAPRTSELAHDASRALTNLSTDLLSTTEELSHRGARKTPDPTTPGADPQARLVPHRRSAGGHHPAWLV